MAIEKIKIEKIRIPEFGYTIPVDVNEIINNPYSAITKPSLNERSKKPCVIVNTYPNKDHEGYIHYSILSVATGNHCSSKRPTTPEFASFAIDFELEKSGLKCTDLKWKKEKIKQDFSITQEYVYFLRAGSFIKIGKTTGVPHARIDSLQTGCPFKIYLAAYMKGGLDKEAELHARFIGYKTHGEWFHDKGELKKFVDSIAGDNK